MDKRYYCGNFEEEVIIARKYSAFLFHNDYITENEYFKIRTRITKKLKEKGLIITEDFKILRNIPK